MEVLRKAGPGVAQMDYHFPARNGISELDVSERFDEVEYMMRQLFGTGGKLMLVETLSKLCVEYSLDLNLSHGTSLNNRLDQLKDRILVDKLTPKHYRNKIETASFEDRTGTSAGWTG